MAPTRRQARGPTLTLLVIAGLGPGCGGLAAPPVQIPRAAAQPSGLRADAPPTEELRPGDTIALEIRSDTVRSYPDLPVFATGGIHIPGLGDVQVGGTTVPDAERRVLQRVRSQDALAQVSLHVSTRVGRRVTVLGAVVRQGAYPIQPRMRVADVIAAAGGPVTGTAPDGAVIPLAALEGATLTRAGSALPISIALALRSEPAHNVLVHPGDNIYLPWRERASVTVLGQVGKPGVVPQWRGMRMTEALAASGGVTPDGDRSDIRIVRGPPEAPQVYSASLDALVDGDGRDVELAPGDVLFVTDSWLEDAREVLGVIAPLVALASLPMLVLILSAQ